MIEQCLPLLLLLSLASQDARSSAAIVGTDTHTAAGRCAYSEFIEAIGLIMEARGPLLPAEELLLSVVVLVVVMDWSS